MSSLKTTLKRWSLERQVLSSPPIKDRKKFLLIKQMLIRARINAEYDELQGIVRISLNGSESKGKLNIEKMEELQVTF